MHQKEEWKRKEKLLRLYNSEYKTIIEYTGEFCLPAFGVRNSGSWEDGSRHVLLHIYWIFGKLYVHLPLKPWFRGEWGIMFTDIDGDGWQQIHINYGYHKDKEKGERYKIFDMPWSFQHYQTSYLVLDPCILCLFWLDETKGKKKFFDRYSEGFKEYDYAKTFPYLYILKDGTAQHRYATVRQEKRVWRRKWLPFTNLFSLHRHTISIDFDREVGERAKSWKGGTLGCSFLMLPGESSEQALRRMEATRRFDR
jgi:hypothetical protein